MNCIKAQAILSCYQMIRKMTFSLRIDRKQASYLKQLKLI